MKLAIVGSRSFDDYDLVKQKLKGLDVTEIVSGGAKGADSLAEQYAKENNIPIKIFKPDWSRFGRSAGMVRNKDIVDYSEKVIAFWDGESKGTKNSIYLSKRQGKLLDVVNFTSRG
jgi:hypothetical protein